MIIRFYFICVLAVLINKVSLQVTGVIGGFAVLPCSSTEHDHEPQETEVHWRQNGKKNVFDVIKGKDSLQKQDPRYKNRTKTFPEEYKRGNFSIKLNKLQPTDAGKYTCLITHASEHRIVELIINETTTEYETKSPITENGTDQETQQPSSLIRVYITVAVGLLIMLIAFIIIGCRKKIQAALFSPVMMEEKRTATEINV